jgi:hypothetical protein
MIRTSRVGNTKSIAEIGCGDSHIEAMAAAHSNPENPCSNRLKNVTAK